jgi:hypothetical protein
MNNLSYHKKIHEKNKEFYSIVIVKTCKACNKCGWLIKSKSKAIKWGIDIFTHIQCTRK